MTDRADVRLLAYRALYQVLERDGQSHIVFRETLKKNQALPKGERAFFSRLCEGVLERLIRLDYILDRFCKTPVKKQKPPLRTALRMAVYQMFYMESVPDRAAISETLRLLEQNGLPGLKGFANGVLRNLSRQKDQIPFPAEEKEPVAWLSLEASAPIWLTEAFCRDFGYEKAKKMLLTSVEPAKITARIQNAKMEEVTESLHRQGISFRPVFGFPEALVLWNIDYPEGIEAFQKGWLQIQDISSMLVCRAANISQGNHVVDLCAAPGGKTLHIAQALSGTGRILARDLTSKKIALIEENKKRAGYQNITASVWDGRKTDPSILGWADVIIADLPCSGLGVLGRKKEIKYHCSPEQILKLQALQREILKASFPYLKPKGRLVYSTCTVTKEENTEQYEWLLKEFPLEPVNLTGLFPEPFDQRTASKGYVQTLQGVMDCDGFFVSAFQRK